MGQYGCSTQHTILERQHEHTRISNSPQSRLSRQCRRTPQRWFLNPTECRFVHAIHVKPLYSTTSGTPNDEFDRCFVSNSHAIHTQHNYDPTLTKTFSIPEVLLLNQCAGKSQPDFYHQDINHPHDKLRNTVATNSNKIDDTCSNIDIQISNLTFNDFRTNCDSEPIPITNNNKNVS